MQICGKLDYNLLGKAMNFCEKNFLIDGGGLINDFLEQ